MSRTDNASDSTPSDGRVLTGPKSNKEFLPLASPQIRGRVMMAHVAEAARAGVQRYLGMPVGRVVLRWWLRGMPGEQWITRWGLPRHNLEEYLGLDALTLHIDPRSLIDEVIFPPRKEKRRPSSMAFIWDGDWDTHREPLLQGSHYRFVCDIDENRDHLERTQRYHDMMAAIERGEPWSNHQKGILVDTPEKIKSFLRIYVGYLDDMAANGYVASLAHDELDVVISREGQILKVSRGLHRMSMALRVGVPSVPIRVKAVHRLWWERVVGDASGPLALQRLRDAVQACAPGGVANSGSDGRKTGSHSV